MEDGLEVYTHLYDPQRLQVCVYETSQRLVAEHPGAHPRHA